MNFLYHSTDNLNQLLLKIETLKEAVTILPKATETRIKTLRQESTLKSSLYSARIEGNPLELHQIHTSQSSRIHKLEILNLQQAHAYIYKQPKPININSELLKKLHSIAMTSINPDAGKFRTQPSAIFDQSGVAVYLTPPPVKVNSLIKELNNYIAKSSDSPPIKAAIAHYRFEKIHPFLDGNGRVGRLMADTILANYDYDFLGLLNLSEYIENYRSLYYSYLSLNQKDLSDYVTFYLKGIVRQAKIAVRTIQQPHQPQPEDTLLPRRREILYIIRDHKMVSFDFIHRRFAAVPRSTLHNDLKQLRVKGHIKKLGTTRGALYSEV